MPTEPRVGPYRPVVLVVLDGWGESRRHGPGARNAIRDARTPNLDRWYRDYPHSVLGASGEDVGLQPGQMGDSNVGHLNLGAGRIVYQDLVRINHAVGHGELGLRPAIRELFRGTAAAGGTLHLMGLVSDGGVHSHLQHLYALLDASRAHGVSSVRVHAFLDGRDVPPQSAGRYLEDLTGRMSGLADCRLASICGRYYAMDRDQRWSRTEPAYMAITGRGGPEVPGWPGALEASYARGETDEFVRPVRLAGAGPMSPGDGLFFFNFRADRARQLTRAFAEGPGFSGFIRPAPGPRVSLATMTRYDSGLPVPAAFEPQDLTGTLGEAVSRAGLRQLRLAETEKYAHVTFFFSGGREELFPGEDRILVSSPKVSTYDLQPEMSAPEVSREAVRALREGAHDLIVMNYANCDMVGHTGDYGATMRAVHAVDQGLGTVVVALLERGGAALVVADHGNAEEMWDEQGQSPHTAHTRNPVPSLLIAPGLSVGLRLRCGILADVAPTLLELLGLPVPSEMEGRSLIELAGGPDRSRATRGPGKEDQG